MPDLTEEEKKVILFLLVVAVCGTAVNMLAKSNCRLQKVLCRQEGLSRLNLNKVSLEEMVASRCVLPKTARNIADYRHSHGGFGSLEELMRVKGIGSRRYQKLKEIFFVE
jgi:competence protein ComEA